MRKKEKTDNYNRLDKYFKALDEEKTEDYHDKHNNVWLKQYDDRHTKNEGA